MSVTCILCSDTLGVFALVLVCVAFLAYAVGPPPKK